MSGESSKPPNPETQDAYLETLKRVQLWAQKVEELYHAERKVESIRAEVQKMERDPLLSNLRGQVRGALKVSPPSAPGSESVKKPASAKSKKPAPANPSTTTESVPTPQESGPSTLSKKRKVDEENTGSLASQDTATI